MDSSSVALWALEPQTWGLGEKKQDLIEYPSQREQCKVGLEKSGQ